MCTIIIVSVRAAVPLRVQQQKLSVLESAAVPHRVQQRKVILILSNSVSAAVPYREQQHKLYSASLPANKAGCVMYFFVSNRGAEKKIIQTVYCTFLVMVIVGSIISTPQSNEKVNSSIWF
jgi:hypothetical protein